MYIDYQMISILSWKRFMKWKKYLSQYPRTLQVFHNDSLYNDVWKHTSAMNTLDVARVGQAEFRKEREREWVSECLCPSKLITYDLYCFSTGTRCRTPPPASFTDCISGEQTDEAEGKFISIHFRNSSLLQWLACPTKVIRLYAFWWLEIVLVYNTLEVYYTTLPENLVLWSLGWPDTFKLYCTVELYYG